MELQPHWQQIRSAFESGIRSSLHRAIGTVSADGYPHVTPIGFIFLRDDYTAYYFEEYTKKLPANIRHNPRVCLMVVNSSRLLWVTSLFQGKFASPPGIRLLGIEGERRLATEQEKATYRARVKPFRKLKGYDLIRRDMSYVREIKLGASSRFSIRT